jgi:hypothetical protein
MFDIDKCNWMVRGLEVVEETGIYADSAGFPVPAAVFLKGRTVAEGATAACRAEVMSDKT